MKEIENETIRQRVVRLIEARAQVENDIVAMAAALGAEAFKAGKVCVPAMDPNVMPLLRARPPGQSVVPILSAWLSAWHAENLK